MARHRPAYACTHCGARFPKWMGRCPECGAWHTVEEDLSAFGDGVVRLRPRPGAEGGPHQARPLRPAPAAPGAGADAASAPPGAGTQPGPGAEPAEPPEPPRLATGIGEVDRVLGGGLLPGSVVLLGGDPGIGKSTLVLQMLDRIAAQGHPTLYVSAEESAGQIRSRATRLGLQGQSVHVLPEVELETILAELDRLRPALAVVDSIQTVRTPELDGIAGNVSQVRACASALIQHAKMRGGTVILVGHVTKEGALAGPRTLEHMVDVVLYLEGRDERPQRILRSVKNRFGTIHEIGLFAIGARGLEPVDNPGALFLSERSAGAPGTVVFVAMEGSRPLPIEIQALVGDHANPYARRTAAGLDGNRALLLQAVVEKHLGDALSGVDVYLNVVGGLRIAEPALDAAVVAAMLSSYRNCAVDAGTVVFGEVGLTGELRGVRYTPERLAEAARLGFTRAVVPAGPEGARPRAPKGLKLTPVPTVKALAEALFG
jgi:DNA repair protein RadA/Sms